MTSYISDSHCYEITIFPVSTVHLNTWVINVMSQFTFLSVYLMLFPSSTHQLTFFSSIQSFIPSLPPSSHCLCPFISLHFHHTQLKSAPPCQSVNVTPVHPVTRVMTKATDYIPSTIPMALISWLACSAVWLDHSPSALVCLFIYLGVCTCMKVCVLFLSFLLLTVTVVIQEFLHFFSEGIISTHFGGAFAQCFPEITCQPLWPVPWSLFPQFVRK